MKDATARRKKWKAIVWLYRNWKWWKAMEKLEKRWVAKIG
jgi:hypothetical protein